MFDGVVSQVLPILDQEYVAEQVVLGVLSEQNVVIIPRLLYVLLFIKSFLPTNAFYALYSIFGGNDMIGDHFVGRNKNDFNNNHKKVK